MHRIISRIRELRKTLVIALLVVNRSRESVELAMFEEGLQLQKELARQRLELRRAVLPAPRSAARCRCTRQEPGEMTGGGVSATAAPEGTF